MTLEEAQEVIRKFGDFEESVLISLVASNLTRDYHVLISVARNEDGELRSDLGSNRVMLTFHSCQSLTVQNTFSREQLGPQANWGLNEFNVLRATEADDGLLHFRFGWEDSRYIDIECSRLSIESDLAPIEAAFLEPTTFRF